jgi:hypothetical protein
MAGEDGDGGGGSSKKLLEGKGKGKDPASSSGDTVDRESQDPTLFFLLLFFHLIQVMFLLHSQDDRGEA